MKKQSIFALAAAAVHGQEYIAEFPITVDGSPFAAQYAALSWMNISSEQSGSKVNIGNNSSLMLSEYSSSALLQTFTPNLLGGAIESQVDLSKMECGCVASAHAVAFIGGECSANAGPSGQPSCPSIDLMEANPFAFNTAVHPCPNGDCDPVSQCRFAMA